MPPVLGPRSPSKTALWSWADASGQTVRPSVSAKTETSSPSRYSSTTTRAPASPNTRRSSMSWIARSGLDGIGAQDGALAGREAVRLDHRPATQLRDERARRRGIVEGAEARRRDAVPVEEILGEGLGALQRCRGARGAEGEVSPGRERIDEPERQGALRPHHGEVDPLAAHQIRDREDVVGAHGHALGHARDAGIPRRRVQRPKLRAPGQLPGERMLAAAAPDQEDAETAHEPSPFTQARAISAQRLSGSSSRYMAQWRRADLPSPARSSADARLKWASA